MNSDAHDRTLGKWNPRYGSTCYRSPQRWFLFASARAIEALILQALKIDGRIFWSYFHVDYLKKNRPLA